MRTAVKNALVSLLLALVAAVQLFGVVRGYLCECTGTQTPVATAECVAESCHPGESHDDCCDHEGGHRHQHVEVRESLDATAALSVVMVPAPMLQVVAEVELPAPVWRETLPPTREFTVDTGPPPELVVKATVVLLV